MSPQNTLRRASKQTLMGEELHGHSKMSSIEDYNSTASHESKGRIFFILFSVINVSSSANNLEGIRNLS